MRGAVRLVHEEITFWMAGRVFRFKAEGSWAVFAELEKMARRAEASLGVTVRSSRGRVVEWIET